MASAAFKYVPQTAATTFAYASVWFSFYDIGVLFPRRGADGAGGQVLPQHQEDDVPVQQGKAQLFLLIFSFGIF